MLACTSSVASGPGRKHALGVISCCGPPPREQQGWAVRGSSMDVIWSWRSFTACIFCRLAHEWDFIGQFKYEMWNVGELYPLWCPGGRAQRWTVHSAWQIVGGRKFSLRLWGSPVGCLEGWEAWGKWGPCPYSLPTLLWGGDSQELPLGCYSWEGFFMVLSCGMDRSVTVPCPSTTATLAPMVWPWEDDPGVCCGVKKNLWTVLYWTFRVAPTDYCIWENLVELFSNFPAKFDYLLYQLWFCFFQTSAFTVCHLFTCWKILWK